MNISATQLTTLKSHLADYQLWEVAALLDNDLTSVTAGTAADIDIGHTFLGAAGPVNARLIKAADGADFLFWISASTDPQALAAHFPQMLPYAPAGVVDTGSFPFPHLAAVVLESMKWDYVFISSQSKWDSLAPSAVQDLLATHGIRPNSLADWNGGLYYSGNYKLPLDKLIPVDTTVSLGSVWAAVPATTVAASGQVNYPSPNSLPDLRLRIQLAEKRFAEGLVKRLSLYLELASPLAYYAGGPAALSRKISLLGTIDIGSKTELTVTGTWPLDDDQILIGVSCSLHEVASWLDSSFLSGFTLPDNDTVALSLTFSKTDWTLQKVSFDLTISNWTILAGAFAFPKVHFAVNSFYPASLAIMAARFEAEAAIGTGAATVALRCTGNYPDRDFYFGLASPVRLKKFIKAVSGQDIGFFTENLEIAELSGRYNSVSGYKAFTLAIGNTTGSASGGVGFALENARLGVYGSSTCFFKLGATFTYSYLVGSVSKTIVFAGAAEYMNGWLFSLRYTGHLTLPELGAAFGLGGVPQELKAFVFEELSLVIDSGPATKADAWHHTFYGRFSLPELFGLEHIAIELSIDKTAATTTFSGSFTAEFGGKHVLFSLWANSGEASRLALKLVFPIAGVTIELEAATSTTAGITEKHFTGGTQGLYLPVSDLLQELMAEDYSAIPVALLPELVLEDIYVSYTNTELNVIALTLIEGKEVTFFLQRRMVAGQAQYAFGIATNFDGLGGLPLVGSELRDVTLSNVGFMHVSSGGVFGMPSITKGLQREIVLPTAPGERYEEGFNLTGKLNVASVEHQLTLLLPTTKAVGPATVLPGTAGPEQTSSPAVAPPVAASSAVPKWFELDKKVGPLHLDKAGLAYADEKLYLLISLDLDLAGLVFSLDGLGVGLNPKELLAGTLTKPDFKLSGLGLAFSNGPIDISASFLRSKQLVADDPEPVDVYSGGAIIKFEDITITGIGSYAKYKGQPSLFVYALYEGSLGGPPFFFVTGLAVGFGYNRKVNAPNYDAVARFPLVAMAMQPAPKRKLSEILADLETPDAKTGKLPIEIAIGEYWLAVGVKFTSFEVVHGYLLLIASFGHQPQFAVLGVAELALPLPPPGGSALNPFVYLEMQMAAVLVPAEGYFSVAGSLTPTSYVLTKECHLTGGFAYSMWYDSPDEAKQGQFVMTAGGYHPAFKAPAFYPQVPRLGYIWQVSDYVSIKGQSYFAITPSCGMAGTSMEVLFQAGDIKAWFLARADMLVTWHPLSFVAEVYVELGVSVRLNLLFCHKTVTVSISGALTLWGPPLGGRVRVHVIIVTLTIEFGRPQPGDENHIALTWEEFKRLLPAPEKSCKILAIRGLTQTMKDPASNEEIWVVRGGLFRFTVQSAIPAGYITYNDKVPPQKGAVNIRPMNVRQAASSLTLKLTQKATKKDAHDQLVEDAHGHPIYDWEARRWEEVFGPAAVTPITDSVAPALWGEPLLNDKQEFVQALDAPSNDIVIERQLVGCQVQAPAPESGATFGIIQLAQLENEDVANGELSFPYNPKPWRPQPDYWRASPTGSSFRSPIATSSGKRDGLRDMLSRTGLYTGASSELKVLTAEYDNLFSSHPLQ